MRDQHVPPGSRQLVIAMPSGVRDGFGSFARSVNDFASSPVATGVAFLTVLVWALSGPHFHFSDGWQLVINTGTTIVTFLMVFVLNNAQSRDTSAMNAKLDAIIWAIEAADNRMIGLERRSEAAAKALHDEVVERVDQVVERVDDGEQS
jgi:low affinity Fe/Cu permease